MDNKPLPESPPHYETKWSQADAAALTEAAALLRAGELVAFPTETVYGLGANAWDENAVLKIFLAKERPADNPLIVHIARWDMLDALTTRVDARAKALMDAFWPGPLTLLLPKNPAVPEAVTAGLSSIAIRMPAHPVARALIERADLPIAAPSANRSGRPSPTTAAHVYADMRGRIPLLIDGGTAAYGVESTVLDLMGERPVLLRPGGVTAEALRIHLPDLLVDDAVLRPLAPGTQPRSPGMKYRHYAPNADVWVIEGLPERIVPALCVRYDEAVRAGEKPILLTVHEHTARYGARHTYGMGAAGNPAEMAGALFAALRALDAKGYTLILAEAVDTAGMGLAYMNRLARAAGFQIERV